MIIINKNRVIMIRPKNNDIVFSANQISTLSKSRVVGYNTTYGTWHNTRHYDLDLLTNSFLRKAKIIFYYG